MEKKVIMSVSDREADEQEFSANDFLKPSASKAVNQYLAALRSITIIRQLLPLIIACQQHRGSNLAVLGGDTSFKERLGSLRKEMQRRLLSLEQLNESLSAPLSPDKLQHLNMQWQAVEAWAGTDALEDFNLHNKSIEKLMGLLFQLAQKENFFFLEDDFGISSSPGSHHDDVKLARLVLTEIPELIELLARIRGLATHVAVSNFCDEQHAQWIKQLLKELNRKKEKFRILSLSLQKYSVREVPALVDLLVQDAKIVQLVLYIDQRILNNSDKAADAQYIFKMATDIIDAQTEVMKQGLEFIQRKIHQRFDNKHSELAF